MVKPLEDVIAQAEQVRSDLTELLADVRAERDAVRAATAEAHEAMQGLRAAVKEAKDEMRQVGKAEARKYLAKQMRAAADVLARD